MWIPYVHLLLVAQAMAVSKLDHGPSVTDGQSLDAVPVLTADSSLNPSFHWPVHQSFKTKDLKTSGLAKDVPLVSGVELDPVQSFVLQSGQQSSPPVVVDNHEQDQLASVQGMAGSKWGKTSSDAIKHGIHSDIISPVQDQDVSKAEDYYKVLYKWPKLDLELSKKEYENVEQPPKSDKKVKEDVEPFKWPELDFEKLFVKEYKKIELPPQEVVKKEPKPVKEIPVYVYNLPPWPKAKPIELPKMEPLKEIPLVMYEMPPMPEFQPLPEFKFPEFRIEKYVIPPMPKFEFPKPEPMKQIPLVMYEFPPLPKIELPEVEPIKEIPVVVYELPPWPKMKPIDLPKIKLPEIKIVQYKMPPVEIPKLPEFKWPEMKVVKYEMPPQEKVEIPEVKFVKYQMPDIEPKKLPEVKAPEFKMPEFKPIEWPEFKMPELPQLELPKLPEFKFPDKHFHLPPVQYMHAPAPMPYGYPMVPMNQPVNEFKPWFGKDAGLGKGAVHSHQNFLLHDNQGHVYADGGLTSDFAATQPGFGSQAVYLDNHGHVFLMNDNPSPGHSSQIINGPNLPVSQPAFNPQGYFVANQGLQDQHASFQGKGSKWGFKSHPSASQQGFGSQPVFFDNQGQQLSVLLNDHQGENIQPGLYSQDQGQQNIFSGLHFADSHGFQAIQQPSANQLYIVSNDGSQPSHGDTSQLFISGGKDFPMDSLPPWFDVAQDKGPTVQVVSSGEPQENVPATSTIEL